MPRTLEHFINGQFVGSPAERIQLTNPSTGRAGAEVVLAGGEEINSAVSAASKAFESWKKVSVSYRSDLMLNLREELRRHRQELAELACQEMGKTVSDALAEVDRGVEVLGFCGNIGPLLSMPMNPGVSSGIDVCEIRQPLGVIGSISPFNFPVMIPLIQAAIPIACGNTVVLKPSERSSSCILRCAEIFKKAGLPDGVLNILLGDVDAARGLIEHPDVQAVSLVGSSKVARQVRERGVALNKRVQAFGSGKNHMFVFPDADLDMAADAAVSAAYGAAGQRCMAISVVVAIGDIGDALVQKLAERVPGLVVGDPENSQTQIGPMISREARDRAANFLGKAAEEGARIVIDGRHAISDKEGYFLGPTVIDHVRPGSSCHIEEIFGPVLSVVRASDYSEAAKILRSHPLGNGATVFTRDGGVARKFVEETEAGMVGVNVPIPFPVFFYDFGGWKDSAFSETKLFGPSSIEFYTRIKTVTTRWPDPATSRINLGFPSSN